MVEIRQLRYFVAVAETLHFGRAAERLHLSQPPLSRQIAALEQELGVRLLDRHSRQVALTYAGRRLLQDARIALEGVDQACRNARLAEAGQLGELSIGFMMHAAYTVVPRLTRRFTSAYPQVRVTLRETLPSLLEDEVLSGRFDVGIMFPPAPSRRLRVLPVHREPLCAALPAEHKLALRQVLAPDDLAGQPLIVVSAEASATLRDITIAYCRRSGVAPEVRLEVQLQQTIISMVAENLGIALVPQSVRRFAPPGIAFLDLEDAPYIEHVAAFRADSTNPALASFAGVLADLAG